MPKIEYHKECGAPVEFECDSGCGDPECCWVFESYTCTKCKCLVLDEDIEEREVIVFLDTDGYTAYLKESPNISAGGKTEDEAIKELQIAIQLAYEEQGILLC